MALNKQLVPLPIDKGLDTKLDDKQEQAGFMRQAQNVVYETLLKLRKRNGYEQMSLSILGDSSDIQNPQMLSKYNDELILINDSTLYAYSDTLEKWQNKGTLYPSTTSSSPVVRNANTQTQVSSVYVAGFQATTWLDNAGGVRYAVQDLTNKSFLVADTQVSASGTRPRIGRINNFVYLVYVEGTSIKFRWFSILTPNSLSTATTVASDVHATDNLVDVESTGTRVFVAYNSSVGAAPLRLFYIDETSSASSIVGITGATASDALTMTSDSSSRIIVGYSDGTDIRCVIRSYNLTSILTPTVIESIANVVNIGAITQLSGDYRFYYEVSQVGTQNNYTKQANITVSGTVSGIAVFKRSVGLAARPVIYNSVILVPLVHESTLQSSYFIIDELGHFVTKFANQRAAGLITTGVVPSVSVIGDTQILIPNLVKSRTLEDNGVFFSSSGVTATTIDFDSHDKYQYAQMAGALHICAGILKMYDGASVVEHGFHVFPETLELDSTATTGGFMSDGDYGYVAVYRWTDNTGRDHLSSPTLTPLNVTLSGGTSTQTATVTVPTLRLTEKENVVLDLYRTENAGTIYYKVTSVSSPVINDVTVDTIDITDTVSDTDLISNELLYTTGGVLENIPAPASFLVAPYNNRLAVVGEDTNRVYFSKSFSENEPVSFTDLIYRDIDPIGGSITAIMQMADKMVVFEADSCFYIAGEGPNNLLQQDNMTQPERVSTDIGCLGPEQFELTPQGIIFKSRKGIWNVNPGFSLEYVGARVEGYNSQDVRAVDIVGELNQIRFILSESRALVYNYNLDRWATYENHGGRSSVVIKNDYYYLREDGALYKENRASYSDASSAIKMRIETGWMNFAELQGFQRVYHAMILGAFKSAHKLRVKVAYDYKSAWTQEVLINPTDFIDPATYGEDSPYGSGSPYGGAGNLYQMRVNLERQKCQSIKLLIEDAQDEVGQGLDLSSITLVVGGKQGTNKLPASNRYGTA